MKKDILLVMSDQHNGFYTSHNDEMEDITPNLARISKEGTFLSEAYCNAPLCVPSRMSFLTGKMPSETKIFDNNSVLNSDAVTLAHKMSLKGYKTILIGRMHFKGPDQFHGFDERYLGDITTQYWGQSREDLKGYYSGFKAKSAQELYGYGDSPVIDFDQQVLEKTLEVLKSEASQPLFIVVGFYAPHFPYISNHKKTDFKSQITQAEIEKPVDSVYESLVQKTNLKQVQKIDEIYKNMIFEIDCHLGKLFEAFSSREGLFVYTSDHGDQVGKRSIFGKKTLYQDSIRIPLMIHGVDIEGMIEAPVSLMDLHHILLEFAQTQKIKLKQDHVRVQGIIDEKGIQYWTEAVIQDHYKLMNLNHHLSLYDLNENKSLNIDSTIAQNLISKLEKEASIESLLIHFRNQKEDNEILKKHGKNLNLKWNETKEIKDRYEVPLGLGFDNLKEDL